MLISNVDEAKKEIGKRIKSLIKSKRYSYKEVSESSGISYSYLSDVTNGKYLPSVDTVYKISSLLGINVKELLHGLEYWIKPKGLSFDNLELTDNDYIVYYDLLYKETKNIEYSMDNKEERDTNKSNIKLTLHSVVVEDNSMELVGILKGSTITVKKGDGDKNVEIESEKIYHIKYNNKLLTRKVFDCGDYLILIPFSNDSKFYIEKVKREDLEAIWLVSSVTTILL